MERTANAVSTAARELAAMIDAQHARRVAESLGCAVVILRREPVRYRGRFTGCTAPVFGVPAEFLEAAQILGLSAEAVR